MDATKHSLFTAIFTFQTPIMDEGNGMGEKGKKIMSGKRRGSSPK